MLVNGSNGGKIEKSGNGASFAQIHFQNGGKEEISCQALEQAVRNGGTNALTRVVVTVFPNTGITAISMGKKVIYLDTDRLMIFLRQ